MARLTATGFASVLTLRSLRPFFTPNPLSWISGECIDNQINSVLIILFNFQIQWQLYSVFGVSVNRMIYLQN